MKVWIILALFPVGPVVASAPTDRGNLIVNGSFERREFGVPNAHIETLRAGQTDLVGWAIAEGSVDWIGPTRWPASHGDHSLDVENHGCGTGSPRFTGIARTLDSRRL